MVPYLLTVALVNLGLGFALAVYLGRRYQAVAASAGLGGLTWDELAMGGLGRELTRDHVEHREAGDMSLLGAALNDLQSHVARYAGHLGQADGQLRECKDSRDVPAAQTSLGELLSATEEYIVDREAACERLDQLSARDQSAGDLCGRLRVAAQIEDAEIELVRKAAAALEHQGDPAAALRQMVAHACQLVHANHQLRDALELAVVDATRRSGRLDAPEKAEDLDPLTGALTRAGLEAQLAAWWEHDPQRSRTLSIAVLDIDRFSEINKEWGLRTGDEIIRAIGRLLQSERQGETSIARASGQRFVLLMPDADLRYATSFIERIRQSIEKACFRRGSREVHLTVSCAVAAAAPDDSPSAFLARAELALHEAKRYGRNRTFVHEGKYPTPVIPPVFSIDERQITL